MLRFLSIGAILGMSIIGPAQAKTYVFDYSAVDPVEANDTYGSFTLEDNAGIFTLKSFKGKFGGSKFTTSEVGLIDYSGYMSIGGTLNGVNYASQRTNDFGFVLYDSDLYANAYSAYTRENSDYFFNTDIFIEKGAPVSAVPEPASWALMLGGLGMAGAAMRRRRKAAQVTYA